jgi:hypothetical protein
MGCAKAYYREMNGISNGKTGEYEISIFKFQHEHNYFAHMAELMFIKEDRMDRLGRRGRWGEGVSKVKLVKSCKARCKKDGRLFTQTECWHTGKVEVKRCLAEADYTVVQSGGTPTANLIGNYQEPDWFEVPTLAAEKLEYNDHTDSVKNRRFFTGMHEHLALTPATKGPNNNAGQIMRAVYRFMTCGGLFTSLSEYNWAMWYGTFLLLVALVLQMHCLN